MRMRMSRASLTILVYILDPNFILVVTILLSASVILVTVPEILAEVSAFLTIVMAAMLVAFVILPKDPEGAHVGAINGVERRR
jgi:hypothetical protein